MKFNQPQLEKILGELKPFNATLIAVTKTKPVDAIKEVYDFGHKIFGENKVQEMVGKHEELPVDIRWHLIGHLQTNKVKFIAPFVSLIHSVDSLKLLKEINKEGEKNKRTIDVLLQIYIAEEETKFGLSFEESEKLFASEEIKKMNNVCIKGMMGMATNTEDQNQIRKEFKSLKQFFDRINVEFRIYNLEFLSMGMSSDYKIALEEGSNMVRIGSAIFGKR